MIRLYWKEYQTFLVSFVLIESFTINLIPSLLCFLNEVLLKEKVGQLMVLASFVLVNLRFAICSLGRMC